MLARRLLATSSGALAGAALGFVVVALPFLGVETGMSWAAWHWQEKEAWAIAMLAGATTLALVGYADEFKRVGLLGERWKAITQPRTDRAAPGPAILRANAREKATQVAPTAVEQAAVVAPVDSAKPLAQVLDEQKNSLSRGLALAGWWQELRLFLERVSAIASPYLPALGSLLYVYLYCCAIALCQRLHLLLLSTSDQIILEVLRTLGLVVLIAGATLQVTSVIAAMKLSSKNVQSPQFLCVMRVRHPIMLGWILVLAGLPLAFAAPLPLVALPGVYTAMIWRLRYREQLMRTQFGEEFIAFERKTWRLIPFLR
jgi:protein-S-isoprenylcysteine O-methyltransferase Ste14